MMPEEYEQSQELIRAVTRVASAIEQLDLTERRRNVLLQKLEDRAAASEPYAERIRELQIRLMSTEEAPVPAEESGGGGK